MAVEQCGERSFCCPKVVCRGVHKLQDFLTGEGQIWADLIPSPPRSCRVMYTKKITELGEGSQKGEGNGAQFPPPFPFMVALSMQSVEPRHSQVVLRSNNRQNYGKF